MTDELRITERPSLERPVLIAAFRGWNDGGQGASLAGAFLARQWEAEQFADIDPEEFFDFQVNRPTVRLDEGMQRRLEWPENALYHSRIPGTHRDVVLLLGQEPNMRWQRFARLVVDLGVELGVDLVISLGALLADVPHTRPAPVTGSASDQALVEELGLQLSRYEGPTGIVGVLHDAFRTAGVPSVSLWAAVPHYVSLAPSPKAALALCNRLAQLLNVQIDTSELDEASESYQQQVTDAVATDEETAAYVEELEQRADQITEESIPSGDSLAAELTRFLRERESGEGGSDAARDQ
jgi:proteasome assembly chaperone (PAC2) family protein